MSPARLRPRRPKAAGAQADQVARAGYDHVDGDENDTMSNTLMSTPQSMLPNPMFGTADRSRPVTRSAKSRRLDPTLIEGTDPSTDPQSEAQNRLHLAINGNNELDAISRLEEARDIDYGTTDNKENDESPEAIEDQNSPSQAQHNEPEQDHPTVGGLRVPRRSNRIREMNGLPIAALHIPPTSPGAPSNRPRKKRKTCRNAITKAPRRSPRLAKPLNIFHKYRHLPPEIQLMIWEAAIEPRLVYICNRSSVLGHAQNFGIQNKIPSWFLACRMSAHIAKRNYHKLFGQSVTDGSSAITRPLPSQYINPSVDIVVYEPCHTGCRGYYCAQQYQREDRAAVQKLVVQLDSQNLPPTSEPGWVTISRSWPNVDTLFMMKPAIRGLDSSDKAMIRIKEDDHELALRKLFESWKKGEGRNNKLTTLEFVRVVTQEPDTIPKQDRYQSVEDRQTGFTDDIILD
ncbi:hypothetical protein F4777DRAFT_67069 [Nemania sp. FL0916]|nr:hypothetical protein F4777DRAFT_67069 [Nemania sp. FL0916]